MFVCHESTKIQLSNNLTNARTKSPVFAGAASGIIIPEAYYAKVVFVCNAAKRHNIAFYKAVFLKSEYTL